MNINFQLSPTVKKWLRGLLSAAEGGAIGAIANVVIDPQTFTKVGLKHLGVMAGIGAAIAIRNYLKDAPRQVWTDEQRQMNAQKGQ